MKESSVIFLIENDKDYIYKLEQAFRRASIRNPLKIARYGNEAILYLKGVGIYGDRRTYPLPSLLILDMTNPDGSSMAVLSWIREQERFQGTPVIVLTEPRQERDLQYAFDLGANGHVVKRDNLDSLIEMIMTLELLSERPLSANPRSSHSWTERSDHPF